MYPDLKDKVAVITGAGKRTGMGYAIAKQLARCGVHVVISDIGQASANGYAVRTGSEAEMQDIANELQSQHDVRTLAVAADVMQTASVAQMADIVRQSFPRIHILCNNAGAIFGVPNAIHTYDESDWMDTIDVNLHSVFRVTRAFLPMMMDTHGSIINTASRAGKVPSLFNGAYAVAKAGVIMLTKVMAGELAGAGLRVNAVCPGQISTDLEKWRFNLEAQLFDSTAEAREAKMCQSIPMGRIGTPSEVANLVTFLASSESSYMTGQAINVTGGQLMEL